MAVKLFLRNFHFSTYYKLSKLTFSERNEYFFGKVHSDVVCAIVLRFYVTPSGILLLELPNFLVLTLNKAFLAFKRNFNIQTATKFFCRRL